MRRLVMALALACALSGTVLAGEIHVAGAPAPVTGGTQSSAVVTIILTILSIVAK